MKFLCVLIIADGWIVMKDAEGAHMDGFGRKIDADAEAVEFPVSQAGAERMNCFALVLAMDAFVIACARRCYDSFVMDVERA